MFDFFKNWFFGRILNKHRMLFRWWNGSKFVSSDPFVLLRKLINTDKFDIDEDLKKLKFPDPKIVTITISHIAEGVREIFEVPAFESGGLTELECVQLVMEFMGFTERVKKNGASSLISSGFTTDQSTQDAGSPDASDTNENSASTSTPPE